MRTWSLRHRWLCGWIAAVLLFGQTAAIAYACVPALARVQDSTAIDLARIAEGVDEGCAGHAAASDPSQALRCKAHCQADQQSVNSATGGIDLPSVTDLGALPWHLPDPADALPAVAAATRAQAAGPPAGTPPLYLSLLVLRN
jgi:hypothetical protein